MTTATKEYVWKVTWYPFGADPKRGEVSTCAVASTLAEAVGKVERYFVVDKERVCMVTKAEIVGEWLLRESSDPLKNDER